MCRASFSNPYLVVVSRTDHIQNGQDLLDSLAELKISIMTRYEQWWGAISPVTNISPSVPVPISPPDSANCPPDSGLPVAASASESPGLITGHLQMPLQSTWCVGHTLLHALLVLIELIHRPHPEKPNKM